MPPPPSLGPGVGPRVGPGRERQGAIYRAGVLGRKPLVPTDFPTLERRARASMSARTWAYVAGGAGAGATMRANREAFDRWAIVPRMLRDVSQRDLAVELFGRRLPAPVILAPVGAAALVHPRADLLVASAAAEVGVPFVLSNQGCAPMEECAAAVGESPRWFQLYWSSDEALVDSLLARAAAIRADALVVTLDTTMLGWRPQDLNLGSLPFAQGVGIAHYTSDPRFREIVRARIAAARASGARPEVTLTLGAVRSLLSMTRWHPGRFAANLRSPEPRAAVETFLDIYSKPSLTWADIESLRERTRLPVLLKGILHPDDARRAVDAGVDGIIVSNHGGRQVDGAVASLDALVDVVAAVGDRTTLIFDSGVRSAADIVKALALGASAVAVGRPYVLGLALAGQQGVREVLTNLIAELDLTLGLSGVTSVSDLSPEILRRIR